MITRDTIFGFVCGAVCVIGFLIGTDIAAHQELNHRLARCMQLEQRQGWLAIVRDADCLDALRTRALERKGRR